MKYTVYMIKKMTVEDLVAVWNDFTYDNSWIDDSVYDNDSYGYEMAFGDDMQELARSIHYGEFDYMDKYFVMRNGNIHTFSYDLELITLIDEYELVDWLNEGNASRYSLDIMESYNFENEEGEE